jgi:uncharacterized protein YjbI with pentapeptide repeats
MSDQSTQSTPSVQPVLPEVATLSPDQGITERWGEPVSENRQTELRRMMDSWNASDADHGGSRGPFDEVSLTGAEVYWLAEKVAQEQSGSAKSLPLAGADLHGASLEGATLTFARLEGADLRNATLDDANLSYAHLEGADLSGAHLIGAILFEAHLEGATMRGARLERADLRGVTLDRKTDLANAYLLEPDHKITWVYALTHSPHYGPALGDIHWGDFDLVQLTQLRGWGSLRRLADERDITWRRNALAHGAAMRAYLQVSQRLRSQGFSDDADHLADRAQVLQRKVIFRQMLENKNRPWRLPLNFGRWLFSWFLALLAGYGYHPGRSVLWYLTTIIGFATLYGSIGIIGGHHFNATEAIVFSLTSFHGRGFFPGGLRLDDPVTVLAAGEAVIGLLIEISFIATFTQRFFGSR